MKHLYTTLLLSNMLLFGAACELPADRNKAIFRFEYPQGYTAGVGQLIFSEDGQTLYGLCSKGGYGSELCLLAWQMLDAAVKKEYKYNVENSGIPSLGAFYANDEVIVCIGARLSKHAHIVLHSFGAMVRKKVIKSVSGLAEITDGRLMIFNTDGTQFAYIGKGNWRTQGEDYIVVIDTSVDKKDALILPDGARQIYSAKSRTFKAIDRVSYLAFIQGTSMLVSKSWGTEGRNTIQCWDIDSGDELGEPMSFPGHFLSFSPDGSKYVVSCLASSDKNSELLIHDLVSRSTRSILVENYSKKKLFPTCAELASLSQDNSKLAICTRMDSDLMIYDVDSGKLIAKFDQAHHGETLQVLAFSPDGSTLATGSKTVIKLWRVTCASLQSLASAVICKHRLDTSVLPPLVCKMNHLKTPT